MPVADILYRAPVDDQANDEVAIINVKLPACDPDRLDRILGKACLHTIQDRISSDKIMVRVCRLMKNEKCRLV